MSLDRKKVCLERFDNYFSQFHRSSMDDLFSLFVKCSLIVKFEYFLSIRHKPSTEIPLQMTFNLRWIGRQFVLDPKKKTKFNNRLKSQISQNDSSISHVTDVKNGQQSFCYFKFWFNSYVKEISQFIKKKSKSYHESNRSLKTSN